MWSLWFLSDLWTAGVKSSTLRNYSRYQLSIASFRLAIISSLSRSSFSSSFVFSNEYS